MNNSVSRAFGASGEMGPFAPPPNRRVLWQSMAEVRPGDVVKITAALSANPIDDSEKAKRSGLLVAIWLRRDNQPVDAKLKGFRESEQYGPFQYISFGAGAENIEFSQEFRVPPGAANVLIRIFPFANPSITVTEVVTKRIPQFP